jgi:hypothetical protein
VAIPESFPDAPPQYRLRKTGQLFGYDRLEDPGLVEMMNNLYANEWSL